MCCSGTWGLMVAVDKGIPGSILEDMLMTRTCLWTDMVALSQDSGPINDREIDFLKSLFLQNEIILNITLCTKNVRMISTQLTTDQTNGKKSLQWWIRSVVLPGLLKWKFSKFMPFLSMHSGSQYALVHLGLSGWSGSTASSSSGCLSLSPLHL